MDIYWTDNSSDELGFEVQRINPDSTVDTICNTKPNFTYCFDPGISQSAPYGYLPGEPDNLFFQVRANGARLNSAWTSGAGTTAQEPTISPSPTHGAFTCQALDVTSSSATFRLWNNPFNYHAGFNLYVGSNPAPSYSMIENGTKITFINQSPGSITLKILNPTL